MKQKNLILMVVAVGCGLVAAFLTSQMSAKPKGNDVQLVDVLVASKELTPGTRFTKDSLKDQVKRKKYRPEEVPDNAVTAEEDLIDKQLIKSLRADDYVGHTDLGNYKPLVPPQGKDLISVRLAVDKTTPFVKAGSRIDIIGTGITRRNQVVGTMILPNVLVMAEGINVTPPNGTASGSMTIQLTTLAVNTEEALLIRMCETANFQLSYILRSEDDNRNPLEKWSPEGVKKFLQDFQADQGLGGVAPGGGDKPQAVDGDRAAKVKLPVPTEDLPAGTAITAELVESKFKEVEFVAPVPDNAVTNIKEHLGRFLVEKVAANQFVPKSYIGDKPKAVAPAPKPAQQDPQAAPQAGPKPDPKAGEPRRTFDRTFTTTSGTKVMRFEEQDDGSWKLIGEVKEDGSVVPVQGAPPPPAKPGQAQPVDPKQLT